MGAVELLKCACVSSFDAIVGLRLDMLQGDTILMCSWFDGHLCERALESIDRWIVHEADEVRCCVTHLGDSLRIVAHQRVRPSLPM